MPEFIHQLTRIEKLIESAKAVLDFVERANAPDCPFCGSHDAEFQLHAADCLTHVLRESIAAAEAEVKEAAVRDAKVQELVTGSIQTLTNVAQVFDGWHNDGTAWSEWDESVRKEVSVLLKLARELGGGR